MLQTIIGAAVVTLIYVVTANVLFSRIIKPHIRSIQIELQLIRDLIQAEHVRRS